MKRTAVAAMILMASAPAFPEQPIQAAPQVSVPGDIPAALFADQRSQSVLAVQAMLDRAHFSPGVIDGLMGGNTRRAIQSYRRANGLPVTGAIDSALLQSLDGQRSGAVFSSYTISADDVDGPFVNVPSGMAAMASLDRVAYQNPLELLAEKLHLDQDFLAALNPGTDFSKAGTTIRTVRVGADKLSEPVARIEVDKGRESVRAYAEDGRLLASYPATIGSSTFPSPSGSMEVLGVAPEATYHFDPTGRSWGPDEQLTIAAGPNNPVGGIWIDLSKEGYGIHGSPDPELIGKTASHGCVRLTN